MQKLSDLARGREIQLGLALPLLLAVGSWHYGFYNFVRLATFFGGGFLAWRAYKSHQFGWSVILALLALFFNPFIPTRLPVADWHFADIFTALAFIASPKHKGRIGAEALAEQLAERFTKSSVASFSQRFESKQLGDWLERARKFRSELELQREWIILELVGYLHGYKAAKNSLPDHEKFVDTFIKRCAIAL